MKKMAAKNDYYDYDDYGYDGKAIFDDDDGYNDYVEREIEKEIELQETINSFKSIYVNY